MAGGAQPFVERKGLCRAQEQTDLVVDKGVRAEKIGQKWRLYGKTVLI